MLVPRKSSVPQWPPAPPNDETDDQRKERLKKEAEAKRKSDQIDRVLGAERERMKKVPKAKILLLGARCALTSNRPSQLLT